MCGRQDSIILRCEFCRAGIQQQSTGLLHLHGFEPAAISGAGDRTRLHYGASGVEPPDGNSPPDCCIFIGSNPAAISGAGDRTRLHYGAPGGNAGWQQSTGLLHLHGFESVAYTKIKRSPQAPFYFGAGDRTRTCTAKPEEPKSTESTNSTTPAYCLQPGYFIMGTGECQWTAVGTLEISRRKRAVFTIFVIFVLDIPARCL